MTSHMATVTACCERDAWPGGRCYLHRKGVCMGMRLLVGIAAMAVLVSVSGCGPSDTDLSPDCRILASLDRDLIDRYDSLPADDPSGVKESLSGQVREMRTQFKVACGREL